MHYIPDPIEQLENWEEQAINKYSLPNGRLKCCGCGQPIEAGKVRQVGVAPHGLPACEKCFHEAYQK